MGCIDRPTARSSAQRVTCQRSRAMVAAMALHSASPWGVCCSRPPGWSMQHGKCHPNICAQ